MVEIHSSKLSKTTSEIELIKEELSREIDNTKTELVEYKNEVNEEFEKTNDLQEEIK